MESDLWSKLKKRLRELSIAAADYAEEQALIGKIKFEILTLKHRIEHSQREIGARVQEMSKLPKPPDAFKDTEIKCHLSEIANLESQVARKREEITRVAEQIRNRHPEPAQKPTPPSPESKTRAKPSPKPKAKPSDPK